MPKAKTYNPVDDIYVAKKPIYVEVTGSNEEIGVYDGDKLVFDQSLRKPKHGDILLWEKPDGSQQVAKYDEGYYAFDGEENSTIVGIAVTLVRRIQRRAKPKQATTKSDPKLADLRKQLERLERVPENEGERFRLESEIYKLETAAPDEDEWPEVIGGGE